jgi:hypothetical protein
MSTVNFLGYRRQLVAASLGLVTIGAIAVGAQTPKATLPLEPQRERGASITPAYEGWYANPDGSFSMLIGYYNRNSKEALDIPIGPKNHIDPGGPDQGQPTYFEMGRQWGVFVVKVPKDFGTKVLTWTIVANGETQSIPFTLNKGYPISPFKELGMGNQPPVLAFSQGGAKVTGPPTGVSTSLTGTVNQPVAINVWGEDPKVPGGESAGGLFGRGSSNFVASISLHKFRGPGKVTFDKTRVMVTKQGDMISASATFDTPGDYLLRVQANDESGEGGGGFQCCWTNTYVKVTVRP